MNGRITEGLTPEERLAAVAVLVLERHRRRYLQLGRNEEFADYKDFQEMFRIPIELELCRARIQEVQLLLDTDYKRDRLRTLRAREAHLLNTVKAAAQP